MRDLVQRNGETSLARPQAGVINRWDPWSDFSRIRTEMDSLFNSMFGGSTWPSANIGRFAPPVDLYETKDDYMLHAYLPGMSQEDIHLEVTGNAVHISGESKANAPEQDATIHFRQGGFGQFDLRYTLPLELNTEAVEANYKNGILEVRLPKAETVKPKSVQVKVQQG